MANKEHLALIFTPIDKKYKDADTHYAPSLGLVSLENYMKANHPDFRIDILDGSVTHSMEDIQEYISKEKPDIVGQSIQLISYQNSLLIARWVKEIGGVNILGGHQATQMSEYIISNQKGLVDFVVWGDGEEALLGLTEGRNVEDIPNLVHINPDGNIYRTPKKKIRLDNTPVLDYTRVDLSPYRSLLKQGTFTEPKPLSNYLSYYFSGSRPSIKIY